MFINPTQVTKAMSLNKDELQQVLRDSGYTQTKLIGELAYLGMNAGGQFIYEATNVYADGPCKEKIFVQFRKNEGKTAFYMDADY